MTRNEAIEVIKKEYACVDADCDIERNCGKCPYSMPSKEPILKAYKMAISALEQDEWQNGYDMAWEEAKVFYEQEPCEDADEWVNIAEELIDKDEDSIFFEEKPKCEDAVSRDYLFKVLDDFCGHSRDATITLDTLADIVYELPSVTVQRKSNADGKHVGNTLDAVSREKVLNVINLGWEYRKNCIEAIKKLPSVTRQTGKWIDKEISNPAYPFQDRKIIECSKCHYGIVQARLGYTNYCPNCGCRMLFNRSTENHELNKDLDKKGGK